MVPGASTHLRIARPSGDLERAERFWVQGVGLEVLWRGVPEAPGEHALLMVGWPDAAWHLELVLDEGARPAPTDQDLLVLYLDGPVDPALERRLVAAGGRAVPGTGDYWQRWGTTVEDPDGYRLVLSTRGWP